MDKFSEILRDVENSDEVRKARAKLRKQLDESDRALDREVAESEARLQKAKEEAAKLIADLKRRALKPSPKVRDYRDDRRFVPSIDPFDHSGSPGLGICGMEFVSYRRMDMNQSQYVEWLKNRGESIYEEE
jgi:hypothetical protein